MTRAKATPKAKVPSPGPTATTTQAPAPGGVPVLFTREKLMEITAGLIDETYNRVSGTRFKVQTGDRERLAYIRLLKDLVQMYSDLLDDTGTKKALNATPKVLTPEDLEYEEASQESIRDLQWLTVDRIRPRPR